MIRKFRKSKYPFLAALILGCIFTGSASHAQKVVVSAKLCEGVAVAGYVDNGGFINFLGPGLRFAYKSGSLALGMLPSLKIKKDENPVKNSVIMPALGAGPTFMFKRLAVQVPVYYNPKTSTVNGKWKPGVGIGWKF